MNPGSIRVVVAKRRPWSEKGVGDWTGTRRVCERGGEDRNQTGSGEHAEALH